MAAVRSGAAGCVLADGRFAVVGGQGVDGQLLEDAEAFDAVAGRWEPLPKMATSRTCHALVAVPGGMVAVGGDERAAAAELFDEESGRWIALPHAIDAARDAAARVALMPASAAAL